MSELTVKLFRMFSSAGCFWPRKKNSLRYDALHTRFSLVFLREAPVRINFIFNRKTVFLEWKKGSEIAYREKKLLNDESVISYIFGQLNSADKNTGLFIMCLSEKTLERPSIGASGRSSPNRVERLKCIFRIPTIGMPSRARGFLLCVTKIFDLWSCRRFENF